MWCLKVYAMAAIACPFTAHLSTGEAKAPETESLRCTVLSVSLHLTLKLNHGTQFILKVQHMSVTVLH